MNTEYQTVPMLSDSCENVPTLTMNLSVMTCCGSIELVKVKKQVHFHNTVSVVLIPDRIEYAENDLFEVLWWNNNDYKAFRIASRAYNEEIDQCIESSDTIMVGAM